MRGDAEQEHGVDAEAGEFAALRDRVVDGSPRDARHRRDRSGVAVAFDDEERLDELIEMDAMFAHGGA